MARYFVRGLVLALGAGWASCGALAQGASATCDSAIDKSGVGVMRICKSPDGVARGLQAQMTFGDNEDNNALAEASATDQGRAMVCAALSNVVKNNLPLSSSFYSANNRNLTCNFGATNLPGFAQAGTPTSSPELSAKAAPITPDLTGPTKKLLARDLAAQTSKWDGQRIETTMSCFYADKNDYRCSGGGARIDISRVSNAQGREIVEDRCDTLTKSASRACNFRIVFVYGRYTTHRVSNRSEITLIIPTGEVAELYSVASGRR
ncbi:MULTISPECIES: hypothetical protein [unclassified Beijerinckia]|uniref:hypothetical protein n=1 Tax=unclassified Beijerinckia TaxID=2638183 RepID=UPI00089CCA67|nr:MULTISPECIES: hypothetical protein [unclassified Beijerinckia]MDH7797196.1 hypothetical protein [Beijerinckia sp. GAS462]SEC75973.1 hypothetical protein SAMN05443249_3489 [Beijerinckia sp. 28-YEA-48]